jgi:oligopeptide/dipeptide ABC transporter ATP-binding protein
MTIEPGKDAPDLLQVDGLVVEFASRLGAIRALDGVSFSVRRGRTTCIVGESGCGKSMTARAILQILDPPGRITSGSIRYFPGTGAEPTDIARLDPTDGKMRALRWGEIAMIFQEPMVSLSPVHSIGNQIMEAIRLHAPDTDPRARCVEMLTRVGIPDAARRADAYPFQLSGGMRQRAMIAMALSCRPKLLVADEPTTALDVTTQANIIDLLRTLRDELGMALLFITHDLGVVAEIADEVVVMYAGQVAERGAVRRIFRNPAHPYTRALLQSRPRRGQAKLAAIPGTVPSPLDRPSGCVFRTRCPVAVPGTCDVTAPPFVAIDGESHGARCHFAEPALA